MECHYKHIIEQVMTLLLIAHMPLALCSLNCNFFNQSWATKVLFGISPYDMLNDKAPTYDALKIFACQCFLCMRDYNHGKFNSWSTNYVFIG